MTQTMQPSSTSHQLGLWPTPMQQVDSRLWIKREDLNGFGFGGTKVRALEPILSAATAAGARTLVTGGRRDSNWVALAGLGARHLGLEFHAVLDPGDTEPVAVALMRRWGATVHAAPAPGPDPVNTTIARLAHELHGFGVPRGGASPAGVAGYKSLAAEILRQVPERPLDIVVAFGSGGLTAGLLMGLDGLLTPPERDAVRVCAIAVAKSRSQALDVTLRLTAGDLPVGSPPAASHLQILQPRRGSRRAGSQIAERTGVLLDPVFAGPAWSTYLADRPHDRGCVLIASGGLPAVIDQSLEATL